ncbi:MAG: threonine-phosphate decarboxylase CobD [Methylocella sp.]
MLDSLQCNPARAGEEHGGDLSAARRAFPNAPEPWLDLSTGVNPYAYPFAEPPGESWTRLPDPAALAGLERVAARAYRVPAGAEAVAAPGTQAIINWLPFLFPARRVGILGFTYSEHARAWRNSGAAVSIVDHIDDLKSADVAVIVNPNNPDGRLLAVGDLLALASDLSQRGGVLIVDEAFVDFLGPEASLVPDMPESGVVILRSFGKAYGLPGLRLGFAIAPKNLAAKLRTALGCWPVSGPAIAIGAQALADAFWLRSTRAKVEAAAAALREILAAAGFSSREGLLFKLAKAADAPRRFEALAKSGIWVRRFEMQPDWLRFGLPGSEADRARLRLALGIASKKRD